LSHRVHVYVTDSEYTSFVTPLAVTSQPSLGALVANLRDTDLDTGIELSHLPALNSYWEDVRSLYAPFESGQLSGSSDVYFHEIPGGQYTNLLFQSKQLGLTDRWTDIKRKYAEVRVNKDRIRCSTSCTDTLHRRRPTFSWATYQRLLPRQRLLVTWLNSWYLRTCMLRIFWSKQIVSQYPIRS
jgi:hypothetical protein